MMSDTLLEKLDEYGRSDMYPLHMPGHKRRLGPEELSGVCHMDITEVEGFDDLHDARGVIRQAQDFAASLYGSGETAFLVNGSSGGLLAAICALCQPGAGILLSRGCHRSVYHAAEIRNLLPHYLYPPVNGKYGIAEGISGDEVRRALAKAGSGIQAVVITSPTYEGVVSDIRGICQAAHESGIPVIVDEAHGAHLHFLNDFPLSGVDAGADIVVQSCHKTLPALTQCSLMHMCGSLADRDRVRHMLRVFQTSSPSYLLMGSIDGCMHLLGKRGRQLFETYCRSLQDLRQSLTGMKYLHLFRQEDLEAPGSCGYDPSKLAVCCPQGAGHRLYQMMLQDFHIQWELENTDYILGMTSVGDDPAGLARVREALLCADDRLLREEGLPERRPEERSEERKTGFPVMEAAMSVSQALESAYTYTALARACGQISAGYIYLYPPGIPLAVPGERLTEQAVRQILSWKRGGLRVTGVDDDRIRVVV